MENPPVWRFDQQRIALRDRMRQRHVSDTERSELELFQIIHHVEPDLPGDPGLIKLGPDQPRGERGCVHWHAQFQREIRDRADMVLMSVGQDDPDEIFALAFDELQISEDEVHPRVLVAAEGHAQVDHQPLSVTPVKVDVHADFARAAKRAEQQFLARRHAPRAFCASSASPLIVRSASTASKMLVCRSNSTASPPVAITLAGRPISVRIRSINPSIMAT